MEFVVPSVGAWIETIFRIENNDPTPTVFAEDKKRLDN